MGVLNAYLQRLARKRRERLPLLRAWSEAQQQLQGRKDLKPSVPNTETFLRTLVKFRENTGLGVPDITVQPANDTKGLGDPKRSTKVLWYSHARRGRDYANINTNLGWTF